MVKLNDPFGRVARRDRSQYAAVRLQLRQAQITTADGVRGFVRNVTATAARVIAVTAVAAAVLAIIFPDARSLVIMLAGLVLLWLGADYVKTRLYLARYLREECGD